MTPPFQPCARASDSDDGFSLVELLISLAILALLLAMVPGTLRLGRRAWETPGQLEESPSTAALVFAERQLKSALPIYKRSAQGLQALQFSGSGQSLSFVSELRSGPYGGGLYKIDIGPPSDANAKIAGLAVRLSLFRTEGEAPALQNEERELVSGYRALHFRYFGPTASDKTGQWFAQWPRSDRLPDLVEITAEPNGGSQTSSRPVRVELKLRPIS